MAREISCNQMRQITVLSMLKSDSKSSYIQPVSPAQRSGQIESSWDRSYRKHGLELSVEPPIQSATAARNVITDRSSWTTRLSMHMTSDHQPTERKRKKSSEIRMTAAVLKQDNKIAEPKADKCPTSHFSPFKCFVAWKGGWPRKFACCVLS